MAEVVTGQSRELFEAEGYMLLERVVPDDLLEMLRTECSYFVGYMDSMMDAANETTRGITHRGKRYFISNMYRKSHGLWSFLFSDFMVEIAMSALGNNVYLFNEQWVVKGPEQGMRFSWHQDSGYIKRRNPGTVHRPYLTCWSALDDVNEENGTVYLLPHSRGGTRHEIYDHEHEKGSNDLVGYKGGDPGLPIIVPAGSVVAFSR